MSYVIINDAITSRKEAAPQHFLSNEVFVFSQKIWYGHGGIPLWKENMVLIEQQLHHVGAGLPELFCKQRELFRRCKRLLNKNKYYRSGHLVFTFFVSGSRTDYMVTAENHASFDFPFSEHGVLINISNYIKNSRNTLSKFASQNLGLWAAAKAQIKQHGLHGSLLLNEKGYVCEGIASNIYILKNKELKTPSPETGCYLDVLRPFVLKEAERLRIMILESDNIIPEDIFEADEAFFASEAKGIEWILGVENKRFIRSFTIQLHEYLNVFLKSKTSE